MLKLVLYNSVVIACGLGVSAGAVVLWVIDCLKSTQRDPNSASVGKASSMLGQDVLVVQVHWG